MQTPSIKTPLNTESTAIRSINESSNDIETSDSFSESNTQETNEPAIRLWWKDDDEIDNYDLKDHEKPKKQKIKKEIKRTKKHNPFIAYDPMIYDSYEHDILKLEKPFPCLWTISIAVLISVTFFCEVMQANEKAGLNNLYGIDKSTILLMGGKYAPLILDGEYWRIFTAIVLQSNGLLYVISLFILLITKNIEKKAGIWQTFFTFILSGSYGYILSCLVIPNFVSCGTLGALLGLYGRVICENISTWHMREKPINAIVFDLFLVIAILCLGTTGYSDFFAEFGGLFVGLFFSLLLLPNMSIKKCGNVCNLLCGFLGFPILSTVFMLSLVLFSKQTLDSNFCNWCQLLNCVNISGWCHEQK